MFILPGEESKDLTFNGSDRPSVWSNYNMHRQSVKPAYAELKAAKVTRREIPEMNLNPGKTNVRPTKENTKERNCSLINITGTVG